MVCLCAHWRAVGLSPASGGEPCRQHPDPSAHPRMFPRQDLRVAGVPPRAAGTRARQRLPPGLWALSPCAFVVSPARCSFNDGASVGTRPSQPPDWTAFAENTAGCSVLSGPEWWEGGVSSAWRTCKEITAQQVGSQVLCPTAVDGREAWPQAQARDSEGCRMSLGQTNRTPEARMPLLSKPN